MLYKKRVICGLGTGIRTVFYKLSSCSRCPVSVLCCDKLVFLTVKGITSNVIVRLTDICAYKEVVSKFYLYCVE